MSRVMCACGCAVVLGSVGSVGDVATSRRLLQALTVGDGVLMLTTLGKPRLLPLGVSAAAASSAGVANSPDSTSSKNLRTSTRARFSILNLFFMVDDHGSAPFEVQGSAASSKSIGNILGPDI